MAASVPLFLAGSTSYVGIHLRRALEKRHLQAHCFNGDALDAAALKKALAGIHTAYYLVQTPAMNSMTEEKEYKAAKCFAHACQLQNVQKIIYLGRLGLPRRQ